MFDESLLAYKIEGAYVDQSTRRDVTDICIHVHTLHKLDA